MNIDTQIFHKILVKSKPVIYKTAKDYHIKMGFIPVTEVKTV